jgi:type I restriction enzyme M protein
MSTSYNCELCKKEFKQKNDFRRHTSKKVPCISLSEIQQLEQNKGVTKDIKSQLVNTFKQILNILRDSGEGITGEKALRNMCYLLILKMIEPQLETSINIDNYPYDFSDISDDFVEIHKIKMLQIVRFTNLANEPHENLSTNIKYLWDSILSQHPSTKNIFLKGKNFDIKRDITYKKIIDHLNKITFTDSGFDVLGEAYEEVIQHIMTGKVFGQFFTPVSVKNLMVKLINPQIHPDGKIDTICDPTMGTGGFLISYLKHIKHQADIKQIQPDWNFIKTHGLYGKELESDTYQLAISNMLISTGHMFENMDNGDSIREPITRKFDNILANPPFGIKGLIYDEFDFINTNILKNEYLPIKSNNAVSLFIQVIIYMLNINGKCAIVLPDGEDLTSKTNKTLVAVREYLMKTCNLKKVVYLPSGTFTHVAIKTCIFYFIKKREGKYVLETNISVSKKTKKETGRTYTFHKTHQTTKIKFYEFNESKNETYLLVEVPIEKIANNSYSLNYSEYMKNETESEELEEGIVMKKLGEVCEVNQGNSLTKIGMIDGIYDVIGGGKIIGKHNDKNRDGNDFTLTRVGDININYIDKPYYLTDNGFSLKSKQEDIITKYMYYLLSHNKDYLINLYQGTAQKVISKTGTYYFKNDISITEDQWTLDTTVRK